MEISNIIDMQLDINTALNSNLRKFQHKVIWMLRFQHDGSPSCGLDQLLCKFSLLDVVYEFFSTYDPKNEERKYHFDIVIQYTKKCQKLLFLQNLKNI